MGRHTSSKVVLCASALGALAAMACNGITGAGDIDFRDAKVVDETPTPNDTTTTTGAGGATGSTDTTTVGPATGPTAGVTTSAGAGGDPGPTECEWPDGPYGVAQGMTVPETLSWQGYAPGATEVSTISINDFFDCDGTKGIDAVVIDTSQYG